MSEAKSDDSKVGNLTLYTWIFVIAVLAVLTVVFAL